MSGYNNFTGLASSALSDNSENSSDEPLAITPPSKSDNVCRDYLRNVCKRGNYCRYRHPDLEETRRLSQSSTQESYVFCHDFQNAGCRRNNCRFVHCTREEEEVFRRTGLLPVHLAQAAALGMIAGGDQNVTKGEAPVCIDFLKGECKRGAKCKYRHLTATAYEQELVTSQQKATAEETNFYDETAAKKRKMDGMVGVEFYDTCRVITLTDYQLLEEENQLLRRKVEDLKRHLSVLVATNELLLEQNARYRSCKLITVPPIVAVSQMLTPTITPASICTSRPTAMTALHQGPHGITTMATLSHVAINNREMVLPQQSRLHSLVSIPATAPPAPTIDPSVSMAIVPITVAVDAANIGLTPGTNLAAASLPQQQTLALNMPPPPASMGSMMCNMPNSNFVSYPIMSHTRMPTSSLG